MDFNRAVLPPCAFAEHFICLFPPPGNTLGVAIEAGSAPFGRQGADLRRAGFRATASG